MKLIEEIARYFNTKSLYDVLNIEKDASEEQIKKAYRKVSLLVHPDRVGDDQKDEATKKFQVLAQVHFVLSDPKRRQLYDNHGVISNEDSLDSEADWLEYFRLIFPQITTNDIKNFMDKYTGSKDEEQDLISSYNKYKGDLAKISECFIGYDEDRTVEQLHKLIESGKIKAYPAFINDSEGNKKARKSRAKREAQRAAKANLSMESHDMNDLAAQIHSKSERGFNSMIANLEAKYCSKSKGTKRKRGER